MNWLWAALAAGLVTLIGFGSLMLVAKINPTLEKMEPHEKEAEVVRAQRIVTQAGRLSLSLLKAVSGLAATFPLFALLFWLASEPTQLPPMETALTLLAIYAVGWVIYGWCIRVTDALES